MILKPSFFTHQGERGSKLNLSQGWGLVSAQKVTEHRPLKTSNYSPYLKKIVETSE